MFPAPLEVDRELYLSLLENIHFWYTEFPAPLEADRGLYSILVHFLYWKILVSGPLRG